jgi:hypothetical protein
MCPSFPGEEDVTAFGSIPAGTNGKVATGNYVALAASHYNATTTGHWESGTPTTSGSNAGKNCTTGAYCGNGGLPFPGVVGGKVQKTGLGFQSLSDGTSKVAIITESREETYTSWYSGLASYVVAHWPGKQAPVGSTAATAGQPIYWICTGTCDHALNKGDPRQTPPVYYRATDSHATSPIYRVYGPSSRHPATVIHGYADGHAEGVSDNIDKDVYIHIATRNGREVDNP